MLLKDIVLCWTPTRADGSIFPSRGLLKVATKPLPQGDYGHMKTYGSVNTAWNKATDYQRRSKLNRLFSQIVLDDGLDEVHVREALSVIDDVLPGSLMLNHDWNRGADDSDDEDQGY